MGLLDTEITGAERQQGLAYYEAEASVTAFQTKEADLFNEVLEVYNDVLTEDPAAARHVSIAARRLVQAAKEILRRREEIQPIPQIACSMHWAWYITSTAYAAWAQATLSAMEALANGATPDYYVRHLVNEHETAWRKAQRNEKKFLKQLRIPAREIAQIIERCIKAAQVDHWQPDESSTSHNEDVASETTTQFCPSINLEK